MDPDQVQRFTRVLGTNLEPNFVAHFLQLIKAIMRNGLTLIRVGAAICQRQMACTMEAKETRTDIGKGYFPFDGEKSYISSLKKRMAEMTSIPSEVVNSWEGFKTN